MGAKYMGRKFLAFKMNEVIDAQGFTKEEAYDLLVAADSVMKVRELKEIRIVYRTKDIEYSVYGNKKWIKILMQVVSGVPVEEELVLEGYHTIESLILCYGGSLL